MKVSELLANVRASYINSLSERARLISAHVEPALRNSDGLLVTDGPLDLPTRVDLIPKEGENAGASVRVDSTKQLNFEPVQFEVASTAVVIFPFAWDWAEVTVLGLAGALSSQTVGRWFLRWFDVDDKNALTLEGLYGVLHFMTNPEVEDSQMKATVDLGSAPVEALEDLMFSFSDLGAMEIRIG